MIQKDRNRVRLLLTNTCNRGCFYCHNEGQDKNWDNATMISKEVVKEVLDEVEIACSTVIISGGEPTLHPQFEEIVQMIADCHPLSIHLVTNGKKPETLEKALPYVDIVKLHVDAYNAEVHRKVGGDDIAPLYDSIGMLAKWLSTNPQRTVVTETPLVDLLQAEHIIDANQKLGFQSKFLQVRPINPTDIFPSVWDLPLKRMGFTLIGGDVYKAVWRKEGQIVTLSDLPSSSEKKSLFVHADGHRVEGLPGGLILA